MEPVGKPNGFEQSASNPKPSSPAEMLKGVVSGFCTSPPQKKKS